MIIELVLVVPRSTGLDSDFFPGLQAQPRGCSSVGRAPDLHSGGRRFDPDQLHHFELLWPGGQRSCAVRGVAAGCAAEPLQHGPVAQVARARP
jgi:hypothetical protein